METTHTLGVVLAGGAGRRVGGQDKGLLPLHGRPPVQRVLAALGPQCDEILIVANRNQDEYARYARVIADETAGHAGPLAGIAAALALTAERASPEYVACRWLLTVPVDCPDPPDDLRIRLQSALRAASNSSCAFAQDHHKLQPLFALYSLKYKDELLISARAALAVHASPLRWHMEIGAIAVDFSDRASAFRNLNKLQDFRDYEREQSDIQHPGHPIGISLDYALEIVRQRTTQHPLAGETIALVDAQDRVLGEDIHAPHDLPPFANSAMDGFALRGIDLPSDSERDFTLIGEVFAGATSASAVGENQCTRITTGAPMPAGADTVVIKENVRVENNRVFVTTGETAGANVRAAGEDFAHGDLALGAGTILRAPQLGVLGTLGIAEAPVRRKPRVAVIVTGNELIASGQALGFGQIHDSNGVMLSALVRDAGAEVISQTHVRDEPAALRAALLDAAAQADLIVSSGGVSAGEADHLPALLEELGEIHFHKVRIKPGMPILFGHIGASLYFGLPGNPVSSAVTFAVLVRFALTSMLGETVSGDIRRARLSVPVHKKHARAELLRCTLSCDEQGVLWATPHARQGSGMLRGLVESDALALLPEAPRDFKKGDVITLWPYGPCSVAR